MAPPRPPKRFTTRVVGVSFVPGYPENMYLLEQAVVRATIRGQRHEPLPAVLVRNPENEHDPNAIEVHSPSGVGQIGHVPAQVAVWLAPLLDGGVTYQATLTTVLIHPDHPERPGIEMLLERVEEEDVQEALEEATWD